MLSHWTACCVSVIRAALRLDVLLAALQTHWINRVRLLPFPRNKHKAHYPHSLLCRASAKAGDYGFSTTIPANGETLDMFAFKRWFTRQFTSVLATVLITSAKKRGSFSSRRAAKSARNDGL